MNHVVKSAAAGPRAAPLATLRAVSLFHSTPITERKRKTQWNSGVGSFSSKRSNYYARRARKDSKRTLLHNMSQYAEYLFESWRDEDERCSSRSNDSTSWFRRHWSKGIKKTGFGLNEPPWESYKNKRKGGFEFCASDDDEVETIFRSSFGGQRFYYWSFNSSDYFHSGHPSHGSSSNWKYETDDEIGTSPQGNLTSERQALGLSASGPLKLEEIKSAYRACALRWHPDRHQGSSKVVAEEKFKFCSAAYKSLCDRLAA